MRTSLLIALLIPSVLSAAEFKLIRRFGEPIADRKTGWNGHVDHASWVDDERIVYWSHAGCISCTDVRTGQVAWSLDGIETIQAWSLSSKVRRLAFSERDGTLGKDQGISVIDCDTGKRLVHLDPAKLAGMLKLDYAIPGELALSPSDGRLIFSMFSTFYGRNGHIIDPSYERLESSFEIDASPSDWALSPDGRILSLIADEEVLCVRDLKENRELFFRGKRIREKPRSITAVIDVPFFSHIRSDGRSVIYTEDNSWATGKVFVHKLDTKKTISFDARNGHIEVAVDFASQRIVVTGSDARLTLTDFTGAILADLPKVTLQRNGCVEFSPSGKRIVVGSWDNAVYVFELVE